MVCGLVSAGGAIGGVMNQAIFFLYSPSMSGCEPPPPPPPFPPSIAQRSAATPSADLCCCWQNIDGSEVCIRFLHLSTKYFDDETSRIDQSCSVSSETFPALNFMHKRFSVLRGVQQSFRQGLEVIGKGLPNLPCSNDCGTSWELLMRVQVGIHQVLVVSPRLSRIVSSHGTQIGRVQNRSWQAFQMGNWPAGMIGWVPVSICLHSAPLVVLVANSAFMARS